MKRIAFYGSSLLSAYWNGAATYYRGLLHGLAERGWSISFYEPDVFERQANRDIDPPEWARVIVYPATESGVRCVLDDGRSADIVIKASGVGVFDDVLLAGVLAAPGLRLFWDVDAPATIAAMRSDATHPVRTALSALDSVLTYGGGDLVLAAYRELGARECVTVYNALDPTTHFPVAPDPQYDAALSLLANRLPDRENRINTFFFDAARLLPGRDFLLGGSGWADKSVPPNVRYVGHVPTACHNAFNCSPLAVLNVARNSMATTGFSPATRIFEAAGAGRCIITDVWQGLELFLASDKEVLVARDGKDVADHVASLTPARAARIGAAARRRVLRDHTYDIRATQVDTLLTAALERRA